MSMSYKFLHNFIVLAHNEFVSAQDSLLAPEDGCGSSNGLGQSTSCVWFPGSSAVPGNDVWKGNSRISFFRLPFEPPVYRKQRMSCYCTFFPPHFPFFLSCIVLPDFKSRNVLNSYDFRCSKLIGGNSSQLLSENHVNFQFLCGKNCEARSQSDESLFLQYLFFICYILTAFLPKGNVFNFHTMAYTSAQVQFCFPLKMSVDLM